MPKCIECNQNFASLDGCIHCGRGVCCECVGFHEAECMEDDYDSDLEEDWEDDDDYEDSDLEDDWEDEEDE